MLYPSDYLACKQAVKSWRKTKRDLLCRLKTRGDKKWTAEKYFRLLFVFGWEVADWIIRFVE